VDNITHTFVGAALAEAGLKRRTALGAATLMIGANFPDIDVLGLALPNDIDIRRGTTHGFLALAILPFLLAWLMSQYDKRVRLRRDPTLEPSKFRELVILSAVSIATHPALDFMNIYGMRWLMPFVNKWFYADGLYIVDIWFLAVLVGGVLWSRRVKQSRPARIALGAIAVYTTMMLLITSASRSAIAAVHPGKRFMAAPAMLVPWHRDIILDDGPEYRLGRWSLFGGPPDFSTSTIPTNASDPAAAAARRAPEAQGFLRWARFPFYLVYADSTATATPRVRIGDARYTGLRGEGWATVDITLP
jgi:inner membrane protein